MLIHSPAVGSMRSRTGRNPGGTARPLNRVIVPQSRRGDDRIRNSNGPGSTPVNGKQNRRNRPKTRTGRKKLLWSPTRLILFSLAMGLAGTLYLTHVFQTQGILREVQQLRREYERVARVHADVRRNYDRMTGPAEVYRRAGSLGMVSGGAADPVIMRED